MDNLYFQDLFTESAPVMFVHHGYRSSIHSMIHGRPNEARFHVRGFIDQGSTTIAFDMVVRNKISRLHLALDALKYIPRLRSTAGDLEDMLRREL
jgi:xylulose-5-phosphate/fructose-6-phosphate phosphoketolase